MYSSVNIGANLLQISVVICAKRQRYFNCVNVEYRASLADRFENSLAGSLFASIVVLLSGSGCSCDKLEIRRPSVGAENVVSCTCSGFALAVSDASVLGAAAGAVIV